MESKVNINIEPELLESIKRKVRAKEDYQNIAKRKSNLLKAHKFIEAMRVSKLLDKLEELAVNDFVRNYHGEFVKVNTLLEAMTEEEKERMSAYGNALVLLADAMETAVIECNTLIQRYHPTTRIEMFDKLVEIGKEAKRHVRMLDDYQSDEFYMQAYGDAADNLCELAVNKAKGFIRKVKKHKETTNKKTPRNAEVA